MKKNYRTKWRTKKALTSLAFNPDEGMPTYKKLRAMSGQELTEVAKGALYYINTQRTKMKDTWSPSLEYTMKQIYKRTNGSEDVNINEKINDMRNWAKYNDDGTPTPATRKKMEAIVEFVVAYTGAEYNTPAKARKFIEQQMEVLEDITPEITDEYGEIIKPQWSIQDLKDFWEIYDANRTELEQYGSDEGQLLLAQYFTEHRFGGNYNKETIKSEIHNAFYTKQNTVRKYYKAGFKERDFNIYEGQKGIGRTVKKWKGSTM